MCLSSAAVDVCTILVVNVVLKLSHFRLHDRQLVSGSSLSEPVVLVCRVTQQYQTACPLGVRKSRSQIETEASVERAGGQFWDLLLR
jgi:hypothetical protein